MKLAAEKLKHDEELKEIKDKKRQLEEEFRQERERREAEELKKIEDIKRQLQEELRQERERIANQENVEEGNNFVITSILIL